MQTHDGNIILRVREIKGGGVTLNSGNPMGEGGGIHTNANSGDLAMGNLNLTLSLPYIGFAAQPKNH